MLMYDSVDPAQIPAAAEAVAGYVGGRWPTFAGLAASHPHAHRLSIAVNSEEDADCLDIEAADATPAQAPAWFRRQKARGVKKPVVYCSLNDAHTVVGVLAASGIRRGQYRLWTAHYTYQPHLCSPKCGLHMTASADATQFTNRALARNLDASLVKDSFFDTKRSDVVRRKVLRAWILARRGQGWTWARVKKTANWREWRRLGGK